MLHTAACRPWNINKLYFLNFEILLHPICSNVTYAMYVLWWIWLILTSFEFTFESKMFVHKWNFGIIFIFWIKSLIIKWLSQIILMNLYHIYFNFFFVLTIPIILFYLKIFITFYLIFKIFILFHVINLTSAAGYLGMNQISVSYCLGAVDELSCFEQMGFW